MLAKLSDVLHIITPHMSQATSRMIDKIGLTTVGVTFANGAAVPILNVEDPIWLTVSHVIMVISGSGGLLFLIKQIVDIYFSFKRNSREVEVHSEQKQITKNSKDVE
jgi:hypothetical protein